VVPLFADSLSIAVMTFLHSPYAEFGLLQVLMLTALLANMIEMG
jgi:hypothetical protein